MADYIDPAQKRINDTLARTRAASAATVARANPRASYPSAAGISVTDLAQPEITRADIQSRASQLGAQGGAANVPGSDIPAAARRVAAPGIAVGEIDPATLNPNERAGFARQGYTPPARPSIVPEVPSAPASAASTPAAATTAEVAPAAARGGLGGFASGVARTAARGLGGVGLAYDALDVAHSAKAGDYGRAATGTGLGALDAAALAAPSPITAAAALTGHVADAAFREGGPLSIIPESIGNFINSRNGVQTPDQIRADSDAFMKDRAARGLPVPAQRLPNQTVYPPASFGVNADAASTAPETGPRPSIAALPAAQSDAGRVLPGRVLPGYGRTFSDGSGDPNSPGYIPRTTSAAEIADVGRRVSIADAGVGGNIDSEAAGRTLNLGEGPARTRAGFTANDRRQQLADIERQGNRAEMSRLLKKSETELARGNKKTAQILAGLAEGYKTGEVDPSAQALSAAKINESNAQVENSRSESRRRNYESNLINSALGEPDETKRESIYDTLLAAQGKNSGRIVTLKTPTGGVDQLGNPILQELPFDTRTRRFLYQPTQQSNSIIP